MSLSQKPPEQRLEDRDQQHLLEDLLTISAPRHTVSTHTNINLRSEKEPNGDRVTQRPAIASQLDSRTQSNASAASRLKGNRVAGDAHRKPEPLKTSLSPSGESEDGKRTQNTSTETSQGSTVASGSTETDYSVAPNSSPQQLLTKAATTQMAPESSDHQTHLHQEYELANTGRNYLVQPTMKMDDDGKYQCSQIKERIREAINNDEHKPKKGVDRFYSLGAMMVRHKTVITPKATVVVTCCNKDTYKRLDKIVKSLRKFDTEQQGPMSIYPVVVHVDEPAVQIAHGDHVPSSNTVYASVDDNTSTLSGVVAEVEIITGEAPRKLTIGGTILVQGVSYALTVAHPFQPQYADVLHQCGSGGDEDVAHITDEVSDDDITDEDVFDDKSLRGMYGPDDGEVSLPSPTTTTTTTTTGMPASDVTNIQRNPSVPCATGQPDRSVRVLLGMATICSEPRSSKALSQTGSPIDPDYALIQLRGAEQWKPNLITLPGERFPKELTALSGPFQQTTSGDVWINAGVSGLQKGWLTEGTTFLDYGYTCYEAREILLQQPLGEISSRDFSCGSIQLMF